MEEQQTSVRERLIRAGLEELNEYGLQDFSVRRIAAKCNVSCAAPYKHFPNKRDFLAAIIEYANSLWNKRQQKILNRFTTTREQLLETCREYILFLLENPYLRSALMLKDGPFDEEHLKVKSKLSNTTTELIRSYCAEVGMPPHVVQLKVFVGRSVVYGASLMLENGEYPNTSAFLDEVIQVIDREFDLPWDEAADAQQ